jgi:hypothetical protein
MCNFVPGQAIAIGQTSSLKEALSEAELPGAVSYVPLIFAGGEQFHGRSRLGGAAEEAPLWSYSMAVLTVPHGMEIWGVSAMSAALAGPIRRNEAAADLNHYLPYGAAQRRPRPRLELSDKARQWASAIRPTVKGEVTRYVKNCGVSTDAAAFQKLANLLPSIALIDSGVNAAQLASGRWVRNYDYSADGDGKQLAPSARCDTVGHGTRVAKIIDSILPSEVSLISGKLDDDDVTVLSVSRAFADVVHRERPAVVNLSLAPVDDSLPCPRCGDSVPISAFHSAILPFVLRLGAPSTFVVMAAGNAGQEVNYRHANTIVPNLLFAAALDSRFRRAGYSNCPDGSNAQGVTAYAFGGDAKEVERGCGVIAGDRGSYGTSFAAPFVSANLYACMLAWQIAERDEPISDCIRRYFRRSEHGGWVPDCEGSGLRLL